MVSSDSPGRTVPSGSNAIEPETSGVSPIASLGRFRRASCSATLYRAIPPVIVSDIAPVSSTCFEGGTGVGVGVGVGVD